MDRFTLMDMLNQYAPNLKKTAHMNSGQPFAEGK